MPEKKDEEKEGLHKTDVQAKETAAVKQGQPRSSERARKERCDEKTIMAALCEIAFSEESKDADRIRALDRLSGLIGRKKDEDFVLKRLDAVLKRIFED